MSGDDDAPPHTGQWRAPVTTGLIVVNLLLFGLTSQLLARTPLWPALWPLDSGRFMPWQLLSYSFLHANLTHLAFNMLGLWMFGAELERSHGARRLALLYGASVLTAALVQLGVTHLLGSGAPTIGASGGLFGLMMGYAMAFPKHTIVPVLPPIPMPAWLFVALYAAAELILGVTEQLPGVAHFAHLGGLLGGWLVARRWPPLRGLPAGAAAND